jgi:hypothetical protein
VLFVKTTHLKELLTALPAGLEFEPEATDAGVTVGRVRPRREAPVATYAWAADSGAGRRALEWNSP